MAGPLNFEPPTALQYFAALVAEDASLSVVEAAVAVAQDLDPEQDAQAVLAQIDELADRLRRRLPADAGPVHKLRMLNRYFFDELGFAGNVNDYYDPRNSSLAEVLRTRRGIPVTLPRGEVVLDPFSGRSLSREELEERLLPYRQRHGLVGDFDVPLGLFLQTAAPREILARLLRNLKEIHRSAGDPLRLLAVLERLVILLPEDWSERRDRGLAHAELGHHEQAVRDLSDYLIHCPDAADAPALRARLAQLNGPRRPTLH
ncbi:tetratricopeptide repeat protein [Rubrivivax benzoatilyticus]|uniref:Tetratricopeptide repeat protein n=1 Tax=Rubrivivax benzoatilyticus TaxID=316997 RepID=A0ABX0HQS2_9BURK|nr:tetratricopeptide repeat protein [Rubrivivax benzoatilyticus]NHK97416.1 tetratricopeptide repeat protein [Rubrivivax benzoatilyticus]NHL22889.1 tetratricopeptide repeat protein [Rubrivivax benzoatilyticus]